MTGRELLMVALALIFTLFISGLDALQCINCQGITRYDPDECFNPKERLVIQECAASESCEKKLHHVNRWHTIVSRGCSANCNGRTYIYTDDFQTYCCDSDMCNSADALSIKLIVPLTIAIAVLWQIIRSQ